MDRLWAAVAIVVRRKAGLTCKKRNDAGRWNQIMRQTQDNGARGWNACVWGNVFMAISCQIELRCGSVAVSLRALTLPISFVVLLMSEKSSNTGSSPTLSPCFIGASQALVRSISLKETP